VTALFHALIHLARLRWLGAAFCALAMLCVSTHASAFAGATAHARIDATAINASADISTLAPATATELSQPKDRVGVSDQNFPPHVCSLRVASLGQHLGISPSQRETASVASYAAEGGGLASDAISGARLANQLVYEEASSAFTATGELSPGALQGAKQILASDVLGNAAIPEGFAKYTTQTFVSPSGPFQAHFYMNPESGAVFYGLDYKVIFNLGVRPFTPAVGIVP
jgi:hypothetical protein